MRAPKKAAARGPKASPLPPEAPQDDPAALSSDVLEFVTAIDDYKRQNQRPFPTWSEVLEIVRRLGYRKDRQSA
ncbi:MAG: hypothetical protein IT454_14295 [Planctomycetes bacterium]|nr:hypothetical protein [Planctomycetota bacterium]